MVSSEKKKEVLTSIFKLAANGGGQSLQKQLYELLLEDTNSGKLYKYRTFDSQEYSLFNFKNCTLHCSASTSFNDPFECKIGTTFSSLQDAKYGAELDVLSGLADKCILINNGDIKFEDCTEDEQQIIRKLQNSRLLTELTEKYCDIDLTDEQKSQIIYRNLDVLMEVLQIFCENLKIGGSLEICKRLLPHIVAQISPEGLLVMSQENVTLNDIAEAYGLCADADEIEMTMRLSKRVDPERQSARDSVVRLLNETRNKIDDDLNCFLIGCLCTDCKNRLMWSHYADSHKGFCVEYDFSELKPEELNLLPMPVIYSEERPQIPWAVAMNKTPETVLEANTQIAIGLLTKDREWQYENEWRILISSKDDPELKMPKISCVYLGTMISEENRQKIIGIAKEKHIPVKQMVLDRGVYALHAIDIDC